MPPRVRLNPRVSGRPAPPAKRLVVGVHRLARFGNADFVDHDVAVESVVKNKVRRRRGILRNDNECSGQQYKRKGESFHHESVQFGLQAPSALDKSAQPALAQLSVIHHQPSRCFSLKTSNARGEFLQCQDSTT